ncbi:MAG: ATP-dependent Zn protease [Phormidesmis sp.]
MNPTTLNLLAISVFAFTMLSLVGPLLNISPGAVAIALSGCAGVIALDRFSWQGRGGNLVIDLLSSQSSEYHQRILHHEAGHFLAAHLLDIPVESYTLSAWEGIRAGLPGLGGVVVDTIAISETASGETANGKTASDETANETGGAAGNIPLSDQQINRYCIVWMAGIAAETQTYGSAQGGDDDKAQLTWLWQQTKPSAETQTQLRWALLQAQTLLEKQQAAYKALVSEMASRASVETCCQQIEAHRIP